MTRQTVLISGASRGLGAASARIVAQMESNVVLMARSDKDLRTVAREIEAAGGHALVVVGDVSRAADCQRMVAGAVQAFGGIDAVVNNAGVLTPIAPIADGDPQLWQENWATNLLGPFMLTQAALPYLRQSQGRVINVSAGAAVNPYPGWAAYCSAKAALNHFTRVLAAEEPEITAIAFRPGVVDTAMQATIRREGAEGMPAEIYARFVRHFEEGDLLPPEVPGCALAILAFHAPREWSGAYLPWNQEEVQSLVRQFGCGPAAQD
jgi:NAD(P)-dependent dehydrogenase (short-subunit alcohol dehydrogenase family)